MSESFPRVRYLGLAIAAGLINGFRFEEHPAGGLVSAEPIDPDNLRRFAAIPGYAVEGLTPAAAPAPQVPTGLVTALYHDGTLATGPAPLPRFNDAGSEMVSQHEGGPTAFELAIAADVGKRAAEADAAAQAAAEGETATQTAEQPAETTAEQPAGETTEQPAEAPAPAPAPAPTTASATSKPAVKRTKA